MDGKPVPNLPKGDIKVRFSQAKFDVETLNSYLNKGANIIVVVEENFRPNEQQDFDAVDIIKY